MNLHRGLFRLWVATSAVWMLATYLYFGPTTVIAINSDTGEVLYIDRADRDQWKHALLLVTPGSRELFAFDGHEWRQISTDGGFARRIDSALSSHLAERDKAWRSIKISKDVAVQVSNDFEQLSPYEQAVRVRKFQNFHRDIQEFWITVLGPPVAARILLMFIGWVIAGFRSRRVKLPERVSVKEFLKRADQAKV